MDGACSKSATRNFTAQEIVEFLRNERGEERYRPPPSFIQDRPLRESDSVLPFSLFNCRFCSAVPSENPPRLSPTVGT